MRQSVRPSINDFERQGCNDEEDAWFDEYMKPFNPEEEGEKEESKEEGEPDEKEGRPIFTQDSADMMYNFLSWSQAGSGFYSQAEKPQRQL